MKHLFSKGKNQVAKRLMVLESIANGCDEVKEGLKSVKDKGIFAKVMTKIDPNNNLSSISTRQRTKYSRCPDFKEEKITKLNQMRKELRQEVVEFYNDDLNSTAAPGVKDVIKRGKITYQKRFLREPVYVLHRKFVKETGHQISRATFYNLKPIYVSQQKVQARDTCLCKQHSNFKFMLTKLHQLQLVDTESSSEFIASICCDSTNKSCAFGECPKCKNYKLEIDALEDGDKMVKYYQWTREPFEKEGAKQENSNNYKIPVRNEITCTVTELVQNFNEGLSSFKHHVYTADHQIQNLQEKKKKLKKNEVLMKVDFSQNYVCKLHKEIKDAYYGGAKKQVTIHSGVIYFLNEDEKLECQSFATVSENYRRDAASIWSHLKLIFQHLKNKLPHIDTLHVQSDGPTNQYKNKSNFYLFYYYCKLFKFKNYTWNFTGSGHGKSEADGAGAAVKQHCDRLVARGKDITSVDDLISRLQAADCKVMVIKVPEDYFEKNDKIIAKQSPKPIQKSNSVHQVIYTNGKTGKTKKGDICLRFRYLSCEECEFDKCQHFELEKSAISYC